MKKMSMVLVIVMMMTITSTSVSANTNGYTVNLEDTHLLNLLNDSINVNSKLRNSTNSDTSLQVTQIANETTNEITYATTSLVLTDKDENMIQTLSDYNSLQDKTGNGLNIYATNTINYTIRMSGINVDSIKVNSVSTKINNSISSGSISIQHGYHIVVDFGVTDLVNTASVSNASVGTAYNVNSLHSGFYQRDSGPGANRIYGFAIIYANGSSFEIKNVV